MFSTLSASWSLLSRRNKFALSLLGLLSALANFIDIVALVLLGFIALASTGTEVELPLIETQISGSSADIVGWLLVIGLLFVGKTTIAISLAWAKARYIAKVENHFSRIVINHVIRQDLSKLKQTPKAEVEWSVLRSTQTAFSRVIGQGLSLFTESTLAIAILVVFLLSDWLTALTVLLYFLIVFGLFHLISRKRMSLLGSKVTSGSISVAQQVLDLISNFREITVSGRVSVFIERIVKARKLVAFSNASSTFIQSLPRQVVEMALVAGGVGLVAFQLSNGTFEEAIPVLSIFIAGSFRLISALLPLQRAAMALRYDKPQAESAVSIIRRALASPIEEDDWNSSDSEDFHATRTNQDGWKVQVSEVAFQHLSGKDGGFNLSDISFEVSPGQFVAIVGPSGAGKSTLVNLILGLNSPKSGLILIEGQDPRKARVSRPGVIAYVPQNPGLLPGTVATNIVFDRFDSHIDMRALDAAIDKAGLRSLIEELPQGLDTPVGGHSDSLSGGQIQRIALARALYRSPRLIVLDELTSSLDWENEDLVSSCLKQLKGNVTSIVVSHQFQTVEHADLVIALNQGRIEFKGSLRDYRLTSGLK